MRCAPLLFLIAPALDAAPLFTDITRAAGIDYTNESGGADKHYIIESQAAGGGFLDYDLDGRLDIFLSGGLRADATASTALYRNLGAGAFADATVRAGAGLGGWNMGMAFADYDADGDPDIYLTRWGPDALLANNGDGTFSDATTAAELGSPAWGIGAAFADYDLDGDLDLYVANYIAFELGGPPFFDRWCTHNGVPAACGPAGAAAQRALLSRNEGNGTFAEVGHESGFSGPRFYGMGAAWFDFDADGDPDLYVANDGHPNSLWRNDSGRFADIALATGTAYSGDGRPQAGMGVALGDIDNDLRPDIFVTNFAQDHNTLYRNQGNGFFSDISGRAGLAGSSRPFMGWGTFFFDYDHDGWQDLFVANGHLMPAIERGGGGLHYRQRNQLYRNLSAGKFRQVETDSTLAAAEVSRGAASGDIDSDGDLDILVANLDAAPALLRNDAAAKGHWLLLSLKNGALDAIGARAVITAGDRQQLRKMHTGASFQAQSDTRLHFGLGPAAVADIEITWPDGHIQYFAAGPADRHYTIRRGVDRPLTE